VESDLSTPRLAPRLHRWALTAVLVAAAVGVSRAGSISVFGPQTFVRASGAPVTQTRQFTVPNTSLPFTLHVESDGTASAIVAINGATIFAPTNFTPGVRILERAILLRASNQLAVQMRSEPGTSIIVWISGEDDTPPTIIGKASPPPNALGWNNSDVTVTFTCADAQTGIASCTAPVTVSADVAAKTISGTATDRAGNTATTSVTVSLDKTAPSIAAVVPPTSTGWYNAPVTVTFSCSDALSGMASCSPPAVVSAEGASQAVVGVATDRAGNSATTTARVSIDTTPPTIVASLSPPPDAAGWNDTDVTITFTCTDALSGIASCPPPLVASSQSANEVFSGKAIDRAGNSATTSVTVSIDKSAPTCRC